MIVGALLVALALVFVGYAILQVAHAVTVMTEQLSLGVRLTESAAPSAASPEAPPLEGVVSWPSADGWVDTTPPPDPLTYADAMKTRVSDNGEVTDESPELRGKRGSVIDGR